MKPRGERNLDNISDRASKDSLFSRSPSIEICETGNERWRASKPPQEDFAIYGDRDWEYNIIGEEVNHEGTVLYEVQWSDWSRDDGTNTTWEQPGSTGINEQSFKAWNSVQKRGRRNLALESVGIDVPTKTDIHNTETYLRSQAYREKLDNSTKKNQTTYFDEMSKLIAKQQLFINPNLSTRGPANLSLLGSPEGSSSSSPLRLRSSQRASTQQRTESSARRSSTLARKTPKYSSTTAPVTSISRQIPTSPTISTSSSYRATGSLVSESSSFHSNASHSSLSVHSVVLASPAKRARRIIESDSELSSISLPESSKRLYNHRTLAEDHNSQAVARTSISQRDLLTERWTKSAAEAGAAPIYFVNDVDDELIPWLDQSFTYLECKYAFGKGVQKPSEEFMISCTCANQCSKALQCDCQTLLELEETQLPVYLPSGLFSFFSPDSVEVIECNKSCSCSPKKCNNRVSQRPRRIPIEVFKTRSRGWGVRSTRDVLKGQVLGLYTGLVITRADATTLPYQEYRFDLDHRDNDDNGQPMHELYSVNSRLCGNWTRFINHSCSPNLIIYTVVHDTPPNSGLPFIAFVAVEDIPKRKEFTFDYSPNDALAYYSNKAKAKGKKRSPKGSIECRCGSPNCRGYISTMK